MTDLAEDGVVEVESHSLSGNTAVECSNTGCCDTAMQESWVGDLIEDVVMRLESHDLLAAQIDLQHLCYGV